MTLSETPKIGIFQVEAHNMLMSFSDCDPLDPPCGGSVSAPNTTVGSIATYSCDLGLSLTGDENRTCQSDGYWSGSVPCCEDPCSRKSCDKWRILVESILILSLLDKASRMFDLT